MFVTFKFDSNFKIQNTTTVKEVFGGGLFSMHVVHLIR